MNHLAESRALPVPTEIILDILALTTPKTVAAFSSTTKQHYSVIQSGSRLWRDVYLNSWDDPEESGWRLEKLKNYDWELETKRATKAISFVEGLHRNGQAYLASNVSASRVYTRAQKQLLSNHLDKMNQVEVFETLCTLVDMLFNAPQFPKSSLNLDTLYRLLPYSSESPLLQMPKQTVTDTNLIQHETGYTMHDLSAILRLYLVAPDDYPQSSWKTNNIRIKARETSYLLSNFTSSDLYDLGPWIEGSGGCINWPVLECLSTCMNFNVIESITEGGWGVDTDFPGTLAAIRPCPPRSPPIDGDWANITGTWSGTYAFIDYSDWIHYNHHENMDGSPPHLGDYREEVGSGKMSLNIHLIPSPDPPIENPTSLEQKYPTLYFEGTSNTPIATTQARGKVFLTPSAGNGRIPPQVRFQIIIAYGGQDRWSLNGVQVGGIGSSKGFVGSWSEANRSPLSPMGPFLYFKGSEESFEGMQEAVFESDDEDFEPSDSEDENMTIQEDEEEDEDGEDEEIIMAQ